MSAEENRGRDNSTNKFTAYEMADQSKALNIEFNLFFNPTPFVSSSNHPLEYTSRLQHSVQNN